MDIQRERGGEEREKERDWLESMQSARVDDDDNQIGQWTKEIQEKNIVKE